MKKYFAELVGTFFLVFFGVGTAVITGDMVGIVGIAFAFGLGLIAAAYGIGPISGCHINPAVSIGVWVAGRMKTIDLIGYWVGQFIGATLAAGGLSHRQRSRRRLQHGRQRPWPERLWPRLPGRLQPDRGHPL